MRSFKIRTFHQTLLWLSNHWR